MTAHILAFPNAAPVGRALDNARQIIRDPKGLHPDAIVMEACGFLAEFGDWMDEADALKMRRAIEAEAAFAAEYGTPAPRSTITLDGLVIWGFAAWFAFIAGVWIAKLAFAMGVM